MLAIQHSFAQACGIYRIKYVGQVINEDIDILRAKLPTISFLHGKEGDNIAFANTESFLKNNTIECEVSSPMTSTLFDRGSSYKKFYTSISPNISIIFVVRTKEGKQEIIHKIPWEEINIHRISDPGFGGLFEVNLGKIDLATEHLSY